MGESVEESVDGSIGHVRDWRAVIARALWLLSEEGVKAPVTLDEIREYLQELDPPLSLRAGAIANVLVQLSHESHPFILGETPEGDLIVRKVFRSLGDMLA